MVYRLLAAAYAVAITFVSIVVHPSYLLPWPVWLTNWSFLLLTCHLLCAAVIVLLDTCCGQRQPPLPLTPGSTFVPCYMKFSWFLFCIATPAAVIVSVVYFASVFPNYHRNYLNFEDANLHLMNSVLVVLEFTLAAFPFRLLHIVYVYCYGLAYVVFSVIYWAFDNSNVLYPRVLDWNHPVSTIIVMVVLFVVGFPLMQLILFGIYQLRKSIYTRCFHQH